MSLFKIEEPTECSVGISCKNSITTIGKARAQCCDCRLAPDNANVTSSRWRPVSSRDKHPVIEQEKLEAARAKKQASFAKRQGVDRNRRAVGKQAARSEAAVITATKNSGRSFKDGDFTAAGMITLDNKDQSQLINPVVRLDELQKVRLDAQRAGNPIGGLVLRNKFGVGVVVFLEKDFGSILGYLTEKTHDQQ